MTDALDLCLSRSEGCRSRMNRVAAEHQIMRMFGRRTENEPRRSLRLNDQGVVGFLEHDQFAGGDRFRRAKLPVGDREPRYLVSQRGLINPPFTRRELNVQIVDALRSQNRAFCTAMGAHDDPRGVLLGYMIRG